MSTDRDVTRIVRSWLEEGVTQLPDRVLDAVLDQVPTTSQRRAWWPAWRLPLMNPAYKFGFAAVVVVLAAIIGFSLINNQVGRSEPTPTPNPTPSPTPQALLEGALGPGTFTTTPFDGQSTRFTFDMPAEWRAGAEWLVEPVASGDVPADGSALLFLEVAGLYSDPCLANTGDPDVSVGTTADDLVAALVAQTAYEATVTTSLAIDGYGATRLELVMPSDFDYATCTDGLFRVWDGPPGSGLPNRWYLWILDVEGNPAVLVADVTAATVDHEAQIEGMVQSLQIVP